MLYLADAPPLPSTSGIVAIPGLILFIGLLLWIIHAAGRRQGRRNLGIQIAGYVVTAIDLPIAYFNNSGYFDPVVFNAENYWNMRAKVALIAMMILPIALVVIYFIIDRFENRNMARMADELGVDYAYGKKSRDDDD